jgi:hypothetical protein
MDVHREQASATLAAHKNAEEERIRQVKEVLPAPILSFSSFQLADQSIQGTPLQQIYLYGALAGEANARP